MEKTVSKSQDFTKGKTSRIRETSRVVEIPLRYDLTGRYAPVALRENDGAEILKRLAERPTEYQDLEGSYYVSGAGNDAIIYLYVSYFSAYGVATCGEEAYTVTFDPRGGSETAAQIVQLRRGGKISRPDEPVREGYDFTGWYADKNGAAFDFNTEIREDTVLYAGWARRSVAADGTRKTYTVSGSVACGEFDGDVRLELRRDNALADAVTTTMRAGQAEYLFRGVVPGEYEVVAVQEGSEESIMLTLPLSVGRS